MKTSTIQGSNVGLDPNIAAMTQAIMIMANAQNQNNVKLNTLEDSVNSINQDVDKLKEQIFTVQDIENIFKDRLRIKPEDITMMNTMGYTVDEDVEVLDMKEVDARLGRLSYLYGKPNGKPMTSLWEQRMFKAIGKTRNEIKIEAQVSMAKQGKHISSLSLGKAIEELPEYLKWGTVILLQIEKENHVFKRMYTRGGLLRSDCNEFKPSYVTRMDKAEFTTWWRHRIRDCAEMCEIDNKLAKKLLYMAFKRNIETKQIFSYNHLRQDLLEQFTGDECKDLEYIINNPNSCLRGKFVTSVTKCLVV